MPQMKFERVPGVLKTVVGYTGGENANPTYRTVCDGDGHTEAIQIEYDPDQVTYDELLDHFSQRAVSSGGPTQYKHAIWYHTEEQREKAREKQPHIDLEPAAEWYDAEDYHQHYLRKNR
eukprot:TRINITY_DN41792_c0_g1_i1.p1 TRINITY_DN41792_c0_g1~~TRINITY_DN41792_c0_g1_i1.p1  ORF type:complete len:119 (-),score=21.30 TRINITY_DN41792_c0_g1_i1:33-389(-)